MTTTEPVLITGATGTLGRQVVTQLRGDGVETRSMSRRAGPGLVVGDLATGAGLRAAVAGVGAVVHLASSPGGGRRTAEVDVAGTRRLLDAATQAGVRHLVYVSIVGVDRVPLPYYRAKLAAEELIRRGPVPWSTVRATQFHSFIEHLLRVSARLGPVVVDRRMRVQPVDPRDVAKVLADRVRKGPSREVEDFGGPQDLPMGKAVDAWRAARGVRRPVLPIRLPGAFGRAVRAGGLCTGARPTGTVTWTEYLAC